MTGQLQQQTLNVDDDEIDLRELFSAIWAGKWLIFVITLFFSIATVFYTLHLPNIYKSEVTLAPAGDTGGLKVPGQLGGLAALAGVDLGGGGVNKTGLALEILNSRAFLGRFIEDNNLVVPIMAAKAWDISTGDLLINEEVYDHKEDKWVRIVEKPLNAKPSTLETIEVLQNILSISQDEKKGIIKISAEHVSPIVAKKIVDDIVVAINESLRARDLAQAEKSIEYLNKKIDETAVSGLRSVFYSLIEEQTKTMLLANVRKEYFFETIDSAVISEKKHKPARALICLSVFFASLLFSCLIVLIRYFSFK